MEDRSPASTTLDVLLADLWLGSAAVANQPADSTGVTGYGPPATKADHSDPIGDSPEDGQLPTTRGVGVTWPSRQTPFESSLKLPADPFLGPTDLFSMGSLPFGVPFIGTGQALGVAVTAPAGPGVPADQPVTLRPSDKSPAPFATPALAGAPEPSASDAQIALGFSSLGEGSSNSPPVAADDSYTVVHDRQLAVDEADGLLANDTDPDGDPLQTALVGNPGHGDLVLHDDGTFIYTPSINYYGSDSFTYTVTDGVATTSLLTADLTINSAGPFDIDGHDAATATSWMSEPDEADYGMQVSTTSSGQIFLRVYDLPDGWTVTGRRVSWDPNVLAVNGVTSPGYIDLDPAGGNEVMTVTALAAGYGQTRITYENDGLIDTGGFGPELAGDAGDVGPLGPGHQGFADVKELEVVERSAPLVSVDFTSDHKLIRENTKNVLKSGNRYNDVEFVRQTKYNAPITHTWDSKIKLDLTFSVAGINVGDQIAIVGTSTDQGLQFDSGTFAAPAGNPITVHLVAKNKLAVDVCKIDVPITWRLFYQDPNTQLMVPGPIMGKSGSHRVYVTAGVPQNPINKPALEVTDIRMERTVAVAKQAIADARAKVAPNSPTYARVVYQIVRQHKFNGKVYKVTVDDAKPGGDPSRAWEVYDTWSVAPPNTGADCISGAAFSTFVANMAGIPGSISYRPLAAKSWTQWGTAIDYPGAQDPSRWVFSLPDSNGRRFIYYLEHIDSSGATNNFEAAVVFQDPQPGGSTFYFPPGTDEPLDGSPMAYDTADKVLYVFDRLAWILPLPGGKFIEIQNPPPIPYTPKPATAKIDT